MEEREGVGYLCSSFSRDRRGFLLASINYRADLGQTYLGSLVGVGCMFDIYINTVAYLCVLSDASPSD